MAEFSLKHRPARSWQKVSITIDPSMAEAVAGYLAGLSGSGVEITSPGQDLRATDMPGFRETVTAYIPLSPEGTGQQEMLEKTGKLRLFLDRLQEIFPGCREPHIHTETVQEEDWGKKWKSHFTTFPITPKLVIKPSWEEAAGFEESNIAERLVIEMDPGLAFGTGHHASTQLALLLLEELLQVETFKPGRVLDVGTGSGILAMACALYGAGDVVAVDNDPDAVVTAAENIARNRLENRVTVSGRDVASLECCFDIVAANITSEVLAALKKSLAGLLVKRGFLVLSGILKGEQEDFIGKVYSAAGFSLIKTLRREEWAALLLQKN